VTVFEKEIEEGGEDRHLLSSLEASLKHIETPELKTPVEKLIALFREPAAGEPLDKAKILDNLAYQSLVWMARAWPKRDIHNHVSPSIHTDWVTEHIASNEKRFRSRFEAWVKDIEEKKPQEKDTVSYHLMKYFLRKRIPWKGDTATKRSVRGIFHSFRGKSNARDLALITNRDFAAAVRHVVRQYFEDGVREVYLQFNPKKEYSASVDATLRAMHRVITSEEKRAHKRFGGEHHVSFVFSFNREKKDPHVTQQALEEVIRLRSERKDYASRMLGVDLSGFETFDRNYYPQREKWQAILGRAREAGFRITTHLGDHTNTDLSVSKQLDFMEDSLRLVGRVENIGHGMVLSPYVEAKQGRMKRNREMARAHALLRDLRARQIGIETSPSDAVFGKNRGSFRVYFWRRNRMEFYPVVDGTSYQTSTLSQWLIRLLLAAPERERGVKPLTVREIRSRVRRAEARTAGESKDYATKPQIGGIEEDSMAIVRELGIFTDLSEIPGVIEEERATLDPDSEINAAMVTRDVNELILGGDLNTNRWEMLDAGRFAEQLDYYLESVADAKGEISSYDAYLVTYEAEALDPYGPGLMDVSGLMLVLIPADGGGVLAGLEPSLPARAETRASLNPTTAGMAPLDSGLIETALKAAAEHGVGHTQFKDLNAKIQKALSVLERAGKKGFLEYLLRRLAGLSEKAWVRESGSAASQLGEYQTAVRTLREGLLEVLVESKMKFTITRNETLVLRGFDLGSGAEDIVIRVTSTERIRLKRGRKTQNFARLQFTTKSRDLFFTMRRDWTSNHFFHHPNGDLNAEAIQEKLAQTRKSKENKKNLRAERGSSVVIYDTATQNELVIDVVWARSGTAAIEIDPADLKEGMEVLIDNQVKWPYRAKPPPKKRRSESRYRLNMTDVPGQSVGVLSVRFGGLDGVSLEAREWIQAILQAGKHRVHTLSSAGEVGLEGITSHSLFPQDLVTDFQHHLNQRILANLFPHLESSYLLPNLDEIRSSAVITNWQDQETISHIERESDKIKNYLLDWIEHNQLTSVIVENINTIPLQIPMAVAIAKVKKERPDIAFIFHHHDFQPERPGFRGMNEGIWQHIGEAFPIRDPSASHVTINHVMKIMMLESMGLHALVAPNVRDFSREPFYLDAAREKEFRQSLHIGEKDILIAHPTRILRRKAIEMSVMLIKMLNDRRPPGTGKYRLLLSGGDVEFTYFNRLKKFTSDLGMRWLAAGDAGDGDVIYMAHQIAANPGQLANGTPVFGLDELYAMADFVSYPSKYEGAGNVVPESFRAKKPLIIHPYLTFQTETRPHGFRVIEYPDHPILA